MRPKHAVDPCKQDGVGYRIPCECGKVYIAKTGRCMHEQIKEHDRDIQLLRTQIPAISEHANKTRHYPLWDEVKFIDRHPDWYSCRVKEAVHIRLHPNNINRDSGIEIPEAWTPKIRQHSNRLLPQQITEGTVSSSNNAYNAMDWNQITTREVCDTPITNNHRGTNSSSK